MLIVMVATYYWFTRWISLFNHLKEVLDVRKRFAFAGENIVRINLWDLVSPEHHQADRCWL